MIDRSTVRRHRLLVVTNLLAWLVEGAYVVTPVDLIPDVLPLIGWADDGTGFLLTVLYSLYVLRVLWSDGVRGLWRSKARTNPSTLLDDKEA